VCSCGGAAILLSNKRFDGFRAKYKLLYTIRSQNASDESFKCVIQTQDEQGALSAWRPRAGRAW
jgi:hypothetical protein